jgi:hypothetical protein
LQSASPLLKGSLRKSLSKFLLASIFLVFSCSYACAQTSTTEFLPEIDAYVQLHSDVRFEFQAKQTREGGEPTQAELGPSVSFYLKPLLKLKDFAKFDLDPSKSRPLVLSTGYRYLVTPDGAPVNRMEPVALFHIPLKGRILISVRNRADLDWSKGKFTWRYRNKVTVEHRITIRDYRPAPYASAEVFYESKYAKWSTTALYAGCTFPAGKHAEFNPYFEHENNTGKSPNQQVNSAGLILSLYF